MTSKRNCDVRVSSRSKSRYRERASTGIGGRLSGSGKPLPYCYLHFAKLWLHRCGEEAGAAFCRGTLSRNVSRESGPVDLQRVGERVTRRSSGIEPGLDANCVDEVCLTWLLLAMHSSRWRHDSPRKRLLPLLGVPV